VVEDTEVSHRLLEVVPDARSAGPYMASAVNPGRGATPSSTQSSSQMWPTGSSNAYIVAIGKTMTNVKMKHWRDLSAGGRGLYLDRPVSMEPNFLKSI
jgi:hypothetical protein